MKLPKDTEASELEEQVAQKVFELETKDADLRVELRDVKIVAVKELVLDADEGKSAIVIFVPVPNLRNVQKVFLHLVRELEKKFSGKQVLVVAQRRILPLPKTGAGGVREERPRSRTLTTVHDAILDDLVFPAVVVGKRTRVTIDGKNVRILIEKQFETVVGYKLDTIAAVYKKLTGRQITFEFQESA